MRCEAADAASQPRELAASPACIIRRAERIEAARGRVTRAMRFAIL